MKDLQRFISLKFHKYSMNSNKIKSGKVPRRMFLFALCALFVFSAGAIAQPVFPVSVGAQIELNYGYVQPGQEDGGLGRIMPYIAVFIPDLGIAKVGYSRNSSDVVDSIGDRHNAEMQVWNVQLGGSLGGSGRPYILGSWSGISRLSASGDTEWNEWGLGVGASFLVSPWLSLTLEAEHRWVEEHVVPELEEDRKATRMQANIGFLVFLM